MLHLENPVRFSKDVKVTIEHGHGNHLDNEMSSVVYWYAEKPSRVVRPPSVANRLPVLCNNQGNWLHDKHRQCPEIAVYGSFLSHGAPPTLLLERGSCRGTKAIGHEFAMSRSNTYFQ